MNTDKEVNKMLTLIKMPPENDEGTFVSEHHSIPTGGGSDLLDCASAHDSILILLRNQGRTMLLQFRAEAKGKYSFTKIGGFTESKHQYLFARIIPDTYFYNEPAQEISASVYFVFPR
jgi:hypothetical protein